jgi:hypothetical protein
MESNHRSGFITANEIGRPKHWHWICRFEIGHRADQSDLVTDGNGHDTWAITLSYSRMGAAVI